MLSYPIDEAETLLGSKLSTAKLSLSNCEEDLDFLREQITVSMPESFTIPSHPSHPPPHPPPPLRVTINMLIMRADNGGGHRQGVQLGSGTEAKGQGGGR